MCNPRKIRIRATRELAEAWDQEVRRQVIRRGSAVAEVRVREPLESSVGGPTLVALAAVLDRAEGWWQDDDGVYRHDVTGGYIAFDPGTRELEIVARESAEVSAVGEAVATVRAEFADTVEAEGVGTYYDDGWRGRTREVAERDAQHELDRSLLAAADARRRQARADADRDAGQAVSEQAERDADAGLAAASAARGEELRAQATASLTAVGIEGRNLFHRALAEAYRDAMLAYARARHADNIRCREDGGVLEIEFEMQV
jgi:FtsH ternary system domain X2